MIHTARPPLIRLALAAALVGCAEDHFASGAEYQRALEICDRTHPHVQGTMADNARCLDREYDAVMAAGGSPTSDAATYRSLRLTVAKRVDDGTMTMLEGDEMMANLRANMAQEGQIRAEQKWAAVAAALAAGAAAVRPVPVVVTNCFRLSATNTTCTSQAR